MSANAKSEAECNYCVRSFVDGSEATSTDFFLLLKTTSHLFGFSRLPRRLCGRICRSHSIRLDAAKAARSPCFHSGLNDDSSCLSEANTPSGGHGDSARSSILVNKNRTASDREMVEDIDRLHGGQDLLARAQAQNCSVP